MSEFMPLTRTYCATSVEGGVVFAHTYDATDVQAAMRIASKYDWTFLGEVDIAEAQEEAEIAAQMEKDLWVPTIH